MLFALVMLVGFILGCILLNLRPEKSDLENRKLTEFPRFKKETFYEGEYRRFTAEDFMNGKYTSAVSTWFSDSFPMREGMYTAEGKIQKLYGFRSNTINAISDGDEIPDIDSLINSISEEETQPEETKTTEAASLDPTETPAETEPAAETQTEPESVDGDELYRNNPNRAGDVNVKDNVGYCVYGFNHKAADEYAAHVARVAEKLEGKAEVYELLIPNNSAIMLDEETKAEWHLPPEDKVIQYFTAKTYSLNKDVRYVNIYNILAEHNDEYLYFKTDHHWTQLGAYYAYVQYCKEAGFTPHELDEYTELDIGEFLGSYYKTNQLTQLADNPDDVIVYQPIATNEFTFYNRENGKMQSGKMVRDLSEVAVSLKYQAFIYGDQSYNEAKNPNLSDGSCCIVVKESFGNCFAPFMIDHYENLIIIDYRYYKGSIVDLAKNYNHPDIVFVNNLEAISDLYVMSQLGAVCDAEPASDN